MSLEKHAERDDNHNKKKNNRRIAFISGIAALLIIAASCFVTKYLNKNPQRLEITSVAYIDHFEAENTTGKHPFSGG